MANTKDNLSKYGKAFIGFDEPSGNVMDSISGYTGTLYNAPTRVTGWDGKGSSMSFNGTNQYIEFNNALMSTGAISVRLKLKPERSSAWQVVFTNANNSNPTNSYGTLLGVSPIDTEFLYFRIINNGFDNTFPFTPIPLGTNGATYGTWIDFCFTWDGQIGSKAKIYVNNMITPFAELTTNRANNTLHSQNFFIGRSSVNSANFFKGQLDQIEIYDSAISLIPDKYLVNHGSQYKYHDGTSWQATTNTEDNFKKYGMNNLNHITEPQWEELVGNKTIAMWSDFEDKQFTSLVLNKKDFTAQDLLGDSPQVIYYTDSDATQIAVETGVDPYSVYDYIGELPTVVAYTESTDDIVVSTTTEPFDIYDEFGDEVEVLYYTDDEAVTNTDLILEANWSPVDDLEGDFEVVTWTDEAPETAQRVLEMKVVPKPQFIKLVSPKRVYGALDDVIVNDISQSYRDEVRYFVAGSTPDKWYVWNKALGKFVVADASTEQAISANGMKHTDLNSITDKQWRTWSDKYLNIGVFLKDNPRDTIVSVVENISYEDYLPRNTSTIKDTSLYILNTTAKIDISFNGNVLKGILSDNDLTRVQYRVLVNGGYFYPSDGSFTKLGDSPQNIEVLIGSKDIKIDDWNTLKVEFQDFFGTTDYWLTQFIGTYSGLMFKNVYGQYYSSEIGEILQYLDFGIVIAGQTTIEHEVILINQYGYDVKNIHLSANTSNFPTGMAIEFSESLAPFIPYPELKLNRTLQNNEEMSFFVRLKTKLGATPDANGSFDIIVRADKA